MNREEMLKAAYELFLREGIRDLNLNKIAEKIGVTRHDLHAAVGDKRELAEQSVEYGLQQLDKTLKSVEASAANPVEALIRTAVAACDAFGEISWMFSEDAPYYPAVVDAIELERQKLQEQQQAIFLQGVEQGYLLGEAYFELLEQLFWQNVTAGSRYREVTLRVLFTVVRGSATERGWQEAERVRKAMEPAG
ncbi:TetR/AcrR family transcriptional regulator [Alistipes provencensis]|uniref:TetR/AcrR family transcriptional regulator n=1 Tax=Alistipes provencensis TaxID=1816676 RepID=UPI0007EC96CE|nr:TetR/AcrR family transcriptional regulator [Alistipes provencensis]